MHPSPTNCPCLVCGRATTKFCGRCQNAWYCSPEHLRDDWPHHRTSCRPAPAALGYSNMITTPPSAEPVDEYISVSGILFVAGEDRPRIITVKCRPPHHPAQGLCPIPMLQPYFDAPPESVILTRGLNGELLRFPLHVFYSPTALAIASPINRLIYPTTSGAASKPWYGNVVVLKFSDSHHRGYSEAGSNDLPALSPCFLSYQ